MYSRIAASLICLYPRCWRRRYGKEFVALLEQHPSSLKTFVNTIWSAGDAHMQAAVSRERNQSVIVGSVWSAWMMAILAGLILYGMVDDSPLLSAMDHSSLFAASWRLIQAGCLLTISAIVIAGLPLASSICIYAVRERRRDIYLRLAVPFMSVFALIAWMAAVFVFTGGHWTASPWAVSFSRPDEPSDSVRWITASISAVLLILGCFASAASVSRVLRASRFPDLKITFFGLSVFVKPLSFAAALAPWATVGIFSMLTGVVIWGCAACRLSTALFRSYSGPLGLSGLASWILSAVLFAFAVAISAQAAWRNRSFATES